MLLNETSFNTKEIIMDISIIYYFILMGCLFFVEFFFLFALYLVINPRCS